MIKPCYLLTAAADVHEAAVENETGVKVAVLSV